MLSEIIFEVITMKCFAKTLLILLAALFILPLNAEAGFGTGIGISFPAGGSSSSSQSNSSYAIFSFGAITEELTVAEKSGKLKLELKVTNNGDSAYIVDHKDGQIYDFALLDKNGKTIYKWSDDMSFTQALTSSTINAHDFAVYSAEIDRKTYRKLKDNGVLATAWLLDTPYTISTKLPTTIAINTNPVIIHGGVILGNGHFDYD